ARTVLTCRRADSGLWEHPLDHRVLQYLLREGFYGVYRIGHIRLDHALITALVERWHTETHTFHFPIGEATVTLQDVSVLYGLQIDSRAITGVDLSFATEQWIALCAELLGVAPTLADLQAGRLRVRWLAEQFAHLPDHALDELVQQHTRAYILWLIEGVLLPNKSQNLLKLMYLPLLRDIKEIGQYSWGSTALAWLYRMLCRAAQVGTREIGGPLVIVIVFKLLQIWAWERLIRIAPSRRQLVGPGELPMGEGDMQLPIEPRGSRWRFIWQPYVGVLGTLPEYCRLGQEIWMARVPLICFDVVEWHLPHRVLRQFGRVQSVPDRFDTEWQLHVTDRRGRAGTDWHLFYMPYIRLWDAHRDSIVQVDYSDE
ncbi:hypothetical protein LOK49_LG03G02975, partial [Camellia lanceoleosa]